MLNLPVIKQETFFIILNIIIVIGAFLFMLASGIALWKDTNDNFWVLFLVFVATTLFFIVYSIQLYLALHHEFVMYKFDGSVRRSKIPKNIGIGEIMLD